MAMTLLVLTEVLVLWEVAPLWEVAAVESWHLLVGQLPGFPEGRGQDAGWWEL